MIELHLKILLITFKICIMVIAQKQKRRFRYSRTIKFPRAFLIGKTIDIFDFCNSIGLSLVFKILIIGY